MDVFQLSRPATRKFGPSDEKMIWRQVEVFHGCDPPADGKVWVGGDGGALMDDATAAHPARACPC